jgi:hypothetical protein
MAMRLFPSTTRPTILCPILAGLAVCLACPAAAQDRDRGGDHDGDRDDRSELLVSRVRYDGNTFGSSETYPLIFSDATVSGVQGSIHIDRFDTVPFSHRRGTMPISGATTSFSSKSEGALMRSVDGRFLTYMGYIGPVGSEGVSNSETPGATLTTNTSPTYNRAVVLIADDGTSTVYPQSNDYSGDNPRAAITVDGQEFYMAGNADSSLNHDGTGPGTTIGARLGLPASTTSLQLGVYVATDRPDESAKQHIKDNNFRSIQIFHGNLYVAKGSGGNGDDGVYQVHQGNGDGLPTGSGNLITKLLGAPATDPATGNPSPLTPFGIWFADSTTLYVADEGYANLDGSGNLLVDPYAGLQKWSLISGTWTLDYIIQDGLHLAEPQTLSHYPVPTATTGLRNITGTRNDDGTVTIYAITGQNSTISGGEPDPTKLVMVRDILAATTMPTKPLRGRFEGTEHFETLQVSGYGEVYRGVALAPEHHEHHDRR